MTSAQKKYGLMTMGLGVVFLYVFMTEVTDRWRGVFQLYGEVTLKEEIVITPEHLAEEKMNLLKKKRSLTSIMANNGSMYEQSQTGVCEYLNACAKESGVRFESLVPVESSLSD
ncbi:MAG: hypothetical protein HY277_06650, partial [Ignavibacteriales bacterium]|nr:hypothetical protein [Ignavibacteriales bacterium]